MFCLKVLVILNLMYTSVYLLTQNISDKRNKYQERWKTKNGIQLKQDILTLLKNGITNDSLHKTPKDLKGLTIEDEEIFTKSPDILKGADLAFIYLFNTHFKNLNFTDASITYAKFYHVTFSDCIFSSTTFYACYLENVTFINCDFLERNDVRNCRFTNVCFKNCFIETNLFHSCRFDEQTHIDTLRSTSQHIKKQIHFDPKELAELYKGLKNSYMAGKVINQSRDCYYLERQAITRYILENPFEKVGNYFLEIIAGYGIKPLRVLLWMVLLFIVFSLIFIAKIGYPDGLLLSTGAYFTNGAGTPYLQDLGIFYQSLFILESLLGILFTTIFVTVMANLWLRER